VLYCIFTFKVWLLMYFGCSFLPFAPTDLTDPELEMNWSSKLQGADKQISLSGLLRPTRLTYTSCYHS
jgi:hypothetical protein